MKSEYPLIPLGEVAKVYSGFAFKSSDMGNSGYPIIKIKNINPPMVDIENCDYIPEEIIHSIPNFDRYLLNSGDILIAMTGATAGKVGRFYSDSNNYFLNQRVGKVHIFGNNLSNSEYIYQIISTKKFSRDILALSSGSAQGNISGSQIETYKIPLPPIEIQNSIGDILGTLDKKIKLNKKTNQTLEEIAKSLFKSWFIDFNPVKAKAEDRSTGLPDEISDLFPDSLEDSELGEIPKNWLVSSIDEFNEITMGQSPPGSTYNESGEGLPFYQGKTDFGFRHPSRRIFCSEPKRLAEQSSTLISVRAPVGSINLANESCCIGRGVASIKSKKGHNSFTYYLLNGIQALFDIYNSEGTVFGAINKNDLSSIRVVNPPSNIRELFDEFATQIDQNISLGIQEINLLTSLRDTLLPKMISGELLISDAEKMIEEVGI